MIRINMESGEDNIPKKNWHQKYIDSRSVGERLADKVAAYIGS